MFNLGMTWPDIVMKFVELHAMSMDPVSVTKKENKDNREEKKTIARLEYFYNELGITNKIKYNYNTFGFRVDTEKKKEADINIQANAGAGAFFPCQYKEAKKKRKQGEYKGDKKTQKN